MPSLFNYFNAVPAVGQAAIDWNHNYGGLGGLANQVNVAYQNAQAQIQNEEEMAKAKTKYEFMRGLGSSPQTSLSPDQAFLLKQIEGSLRRELEELDNALELISTQAEVVRETGTAIRSHISNLRKVANLLGTTPQTEPQQSPPEFVPGLVGVGFVQEQADPFAGAEAQQVAPGPWPVGQG